MNIENEIFKRTIIDFNKLEEYGFKKENNIYKYSKIFMDDFKAEIIVNSDGKLSGKIYDLNTDDEYINFRIESQNGKFVNEVREEYKNILEDIKNHCTDKLYFITKQANRITKSIIEVYGDEPEFVWDKFPGYGIFRNPNNEKWYSLIVNIDKSKLDKNCTGEVEIINLKLEPDKISKLLHKNGFYPAYHMNKQNWLSIILDDTISDEEIIKFIKESHQYTE